MPKALGSTQHRKTGRKGVGLLLPSLAGPEERLPAPLANKHSRSQWTRPWHPAGEGGLRR